MNTSKATSKCLDAFFIFDMIYCSGYWRQFVVSFTPS